MRLLTLGLFFLSFSAYSATVNMEINPNGSMIIIFGDSNIKEWDTRATKFSGSGSFDLDGNKIKKVKSFTIILEAAEIKAKSRSMNRKAAKALEVKKYPLITGTIKSAMVKGNIVTGTMEFDLHGVKKALPFKASVKLSGKKLMVEGEQKLDMTNFKIIPPVSKILFITATAKSDLNIKYKLELVSK